MFSAAQIAYAIKMSKLFVAVGLAVIIAGAYQYKKIAEFVSNSNEVEGIVVEVVGERGKAMRPVVEWVDHTGETRTHYSNVGSSPPDFFVGERVSILYDPYDPKYPVRAKINSTGQLWAVAMLLFIIGMIFCLAASITWYVAAKGGFIYFGDDKKNRMVR